MTHQKSVVVTVARQEATYIQEWIAYQYLVGFDKIIVMLHKYQNESDETFDAIQRLPDYILEKVIVDSANTDNISSVETPIYQRVGMYKAFKTHVKGKFQWMAMFDVDEYLYDSQKRSVAEIFNTLPDAGQIVLPWLVYGHSNRVQSVRYPETRLSAFTYRQPLKKFTGYKSIVRVDSIVEGCAWYHSHFAKINGNTTAINGDKIHDTPVTEWKQIQWALHNRSVNYDTCLVHYRSGSMEDWVGRHKRRPLTVHNTEHDVARFMTHSFADFDDRMMQYNEELKDILQAACPP
jgi:hypothetical protein